MRLIYLITALILISSYCNNKTTKSEPMKSAFKVNSKKINLREKDLSDLDFYELNLNKKNTEILILTGNKRITNRACATIKEFDNLKELHLNGTAITSSGVLSLKTLKKLEILYLPDGFTDNDIAIFTEFPAINYLLASYKMTEKSLVNLFHLKNIQSLDLSPCRLMTDKAFYYLQNFTHLKYLVLPGHLNQQKVATLSQILTQCKILQSKTFQ